MSSKIFETILNRKIENFIQSYIVDANSIFYKDNSLFHPGEFGKYREKTLQDLLKLIINTNFEINEGFIITSTDKISTQCDIIIYNKENLPLLNNGISQFYTVESVIGIGEVKSDLTFVEFSKALIKLAKNKILQNERKGTKSKITFGFLEYDDIVTFLVCRKLKFDVSKVDFKNIYNDIDQKYWHNYILSIEDGIFLYNICFNDFPESMKTIFINAGGNLKENTIWVWQFPIHQENEIIYSCLPIFVKVILDDKLKHIHRFLESIASSINYHTLHNSDLLEYINLKKGNIFNSI